MTPDIPGIADLSKRELGKKFKFIDKVGLELEGGWEADPTAYKVYSDGSVRCRGNRKGESRTDPKSSVKDVFEEINLRYPDDIDESCGMHIHVSVKNGMLYTLTDPKFKDYFYYRMGHLAKYIRKIGNETDYKRFLKRFGGHNEFCSRHFIPNEQLKGSGERRTALNFTAYREHGTMECRMMPMFEKISTARLATYELINTIETYIENYKIKEAPIEVVIEDEEQFPERFSMEESCA